MPFPAKFADRFFKPVMALLLASAILLSACNPATPKAAGIPTPVPPLGENYVPPTPMREENLGQTPSGLTGTLVYYNGDKDGKYQIFTVTLPDGQPKQLTQTNENLDPSWSPDGKQIAYACKVDTHYELCLMNADGSNPHPITQTNYNNWSPRWSPDGKSIAYLTNQPPYAHLYILDVASGKSRRLLNAAGNEGASWWMPDGSRILYMSDRKGFNIFSVKADGSDEQAVTTFGSDDRPAISPDGKLMTFRRQLTQSSFFSGSEIVVTDLKGNNLVLLTNTTQGNDFPSFSPDGKWVVFCVSHGDSTSIEVISVKGGQYAHILSKGLDGRGPMWKP